MMNFEQLAGSCGEWLRGIGPESDIVISSRVRLARNLADFPFIRRCTDIDRANIENVVRQKILAEKELESIFYVDVEDLEKLDRQFLVERQLISREHAESEGARAVAIDEREEYSLMVNEEDHLRVQVIKSGFNLDSAWEQINRIDDLLEKNLPIAFHPERGYLTACPTNVGTGMRVSVMLHLPALVYTRQLEKVFRSFQKLNLAVRGLYGEGSQAMGDFYQISNQMTLGKSEEDLINSVGGEAVPTVIDYERKAREHLLENQRTELLDQVGRAHSTLKNAHKISSEETMQLLSKVRMGVNLGLIENLDIQVLNKLFIATQPAHLQVIRGQALDTASRNIERANYLQQHLKGGSNN